MKYPFVPDPALMKRMGESRLVTTDSIDPAVITNPVEYKDQFNRKCISSILYNNAVPDGAKTTILARSNANKHKSNLADIPHSQNNIIPFAEFNVTPDDISFINKNTEDTNRASMFSSSMNKAASTVADSVVLSTEGSYEGGDSMLPEEDKVKSRGFSSLLTSALLIPNSLTENPETSGLMTDNSLSESLLPRLEMLERATEHADVINERDVPEGRIITMHADIHSYPLASNVFLTESPTFSHIPTNGDIDSFFSLNRDAPENYKMKTDRIYSKSQTAMMISIFPRRRLSK